MFVMFLLHSWLSTSVMKTVFQFSIIKWGLILLAILSSRQCRRSRNGFILTSISNIGKSLIPCKPADVYGRIQSNHRVMSTHLVGVFLDSNTQVNDCDRIIIVNWQKIRRHIDFLVARYSVLRVNILIRGPSSFNCLTNPVIRLQTNAVEIYSQ